MKEKGIMVLTTIKRSIYETYLEWKTKHLCHSYAKHKKYPIELDIDSEYFLTSNKGVYLLSKNQLIQVWSLCTYGIAIQDNKVYMSGFGYENGMQSYVIKGNLQAFLQKRKKHKLEKIFQRSIRTANERIHQICFHQKALWIANTVNNTLIKLDPETNEVISEITPFKDRYGWPILYDVNHINSVSSCNDCLLFTAYRIGKQAMIGILYNDRVVGFAYPFCGIHDIHITEKTVYFSDTFGKNQRGNLIVNGKAITEPFNSHPEGFIVRGIAGSEKQMLVGHSNKGDRQKRQLGKGALLLFQNSKFVKSVEMPFSQIYDITRKNGSHFPVPSGLKSFKDIFDILKNQLGSPIIDESVYRIK